MIGQYQKQNRRWRNFALTFLLPILMMLFLFCLLSTDMAVAPGILPLEKSQGGERIRTLAHTSGNTIRRAVQNGIFLGNAVPVKKTGNISSHSQANPLCRCRLLAKNTSPFQAIPPGDVARYKLHFKNTSGCAGTLVLTPTTQPDWELGGIPASPITLPANKPITITVVHSAPTCALSGTVGVATIAAELDCQACGKPDKDTIPLTTTIKRAPGVELDSEQYVSAGAGETVYFTHTLTNTGSYTDVFDLKATSTLNWEPVVSPTTIFLGPCCSRSIPVSIAVPYSAQREQVDTIEITATSRYSSSVLDRVIDHVGIITSGCQVDLRIAESTQWATPSETVTYTLTVSNVGIRTGTVGIKVNSPQNWPPPIVVPPTTSSLAPGESAVWRVSLTVPPFEPPADKTTIISAILTCTTIDESSAITKNITTTVLPTPVAAIEPNITKTIAVTQDIVEKGITVTFVHTVTNVGNLTDIFIFTGHAVGHSDQEWPVIEPDSREVRPLPEPTTATFIVTILPFPPNVSIISGTLVVTATPQSAPERFATATDWIKDGRLFLPIVTKCFFCDCEGTPPSLRNGDFETGDLEPWIGGGRLPVKITPGPWGSNSARLGDPSYNCSSVPVGSAWLEQTFWTCPSTTLTCRPPTLTFKYRMHTQDNDKNDTFTVTLNGHQILKVGNTGSKTKCNKDEFTTSGTCTIDLANPTDCAGNSIAANFLCTDVTLRFENKNGNNNWYNTWTYVDDVEFTW